MSEYVHHSLEVSGLTISSRLMFWSVDENRYNIEQLSIDIDRMIATAEERARSRSDVELLHAARKHM